MAYIPQGAQWYLAWLVAELTVGGEPRNVVHTNLHLIRADTPEAAYAKALALGRAAEGAYLNPEGRAVVITFRGLHNLKVIHDELNDGAELTYEEQIGVPPEALQHLLRPKEQLSVFRAREVVDKPNYSAQEVWDEVAKHCQPDAGPAANG